MPINKEKQEIKYKIIFNVYITIISVLIIGFYMMPKYDEVIFAKNNFYEKYKSYEELSENWLSFDKFKNIYNNSWNLGNYNLTTQQKEELEALMGDTYTSRIIGESNELFYNSIFINDSDADYITFLQKLREKAFRSELSERNEKIENIVWNNFPIYVSNTKVLFNKNKWDDDFKPSHYYDDTKFISYITNITDVFNLRLNWGISIWNVKEVSTSEKSINTNKNKDAPSSWIYEFEVQLDLKWDKSSILWFLDFVKNVGSVSLVGDTIMPYEDLLGRQYSSLRSENSWSIYENPILEVSQVNFEVYPENNFVAPSRNPWESLITYIQRTWSWRERYETSVTLKFYVRGIPTDKKDKLVNTNFERHKDLYIKYKKLLVFVNSKEFKSKWVESMPIIKDVEKTYSYLEFKMSDINEKYKKYQIWDTKDGYEYFSSLTVVLDKIEENYADIIESNDIIIPSK